MHLMTTTKYIFIFFLAILCTQITELFAQPSILGDKKYVLVIHGGAGAIARDKITPEQEQAYKEKLTEALKAGFKELQQGKTSVEAVVSAIEIMENSPIFNAGKGAVFTNDGKNELDASIMDGATRIAGAVAGVTTIKNPIKAARAVMEKSEHVMLSGKGAEEFAKQVGLDIVPASYFYTEPRWQRLQELLKTDTSKVELDDDKRQSAKMTQVVIRDKIGTVGAVALDQQGNLAAGTSTGGMANKKFGRIGDSPIIGAGNYANDQVAVSCTGWGEFYIRTVAAYNVASRMNLLHKSVQEAAEEVLKEIADLGGNGGLIAIDKNGNYAAPFNTSGMYRGMITKDGKIEVYIF